MGERGGGGGGRGNACALPSAHKEWAWFNRETWSGCGGTLL